MGGAEAIRAQPREIETPIHAHQEDGRYSWRLEPLRGIGYAIETFLHRRDVLLTGWSESELFVQALEKRHSKTVLKGFYLLPNSTGRDVQFTRGEFEA